MQEIKEKFFEGEHALYGLSNAILENVTFGNGESPLKETKDLVIKNNIFKYKYPLWYSDNIKVTDSTFETRDCKIVCVRMNDSLNLVL